jgi:HK97 gp10 family phage protein
MTDSVTFKINGLDELQEKLAKLADEKRIRNAARRAVRRGANVVAEAAKRNAQTIDDPNTREAIHKNIAVSGGGSKRERRVGGAMMRVGIRGGARDMSKYGEFKGAGKGNPGGDTFYWRFLEFGTSEMAARPFMRNAMAQSADQAVSVIAQAANTELDKEIAKINVS